MRTTLNINDISSGKTQRSGKFQMASCRDGGAGSTAVPFLRSFLQTGRRCFRRTGSRGQTGILSPQTICSVALVAGLFAVGCQQSPNSVNDLKAGWDTERVLANPHKGWYHHHLDNGTKKYGLKDDQIVADFPALDHLYLRLAWSYLEPEEGQFDWSLIDQVVEKYQPKGLGVSFRITSKETGRAPDSVAQEVAGVMYATPYWVRQAGAKGVVAEQWNTRSWTPDWDDPVYLEKLDNFHRAFADRYDGRPWVRYVDVGSIGEWGEGHTHFSTKIPPTVEEVKANLDVYLNNYRKTQIVVTDDLLYYGKSDSEVQDLLDYVISHEITFRDDSPLVAWYVENKLDTWSVCHPHLFNQVYLEKPTILESEHYSAVLENGLWLGKNGEETIPGKGVSGAEILRGAIENLHATYIGFHGELEKWLIDNPALARELANMCGYWYFPVSAVVPDRMTRGRQSMMEITWLNKGVAPAYSTFAIRFRLESTKGRESLETTISDSGNLRWLPDKMTSEKYEIDIPDSFPSGKAQIKIQLLDPITGETVEIGLRENLRDTDGYYSIVETEL